MSMKWAKAFPKIETHVRFLPEEEAIAIVRDPRLRARDDRVLQNLISLAQSTGQPAHWKLLTRRVRRGVLQALRYPERYLFNYPSPGQLRMPRPGDAPLLRMPNDLIFFVGIGLNGSCLNIIIVVRTGAGKTTLLMVILIAWSGFGTIIAFENKRELARIANYAQPGEVVLLDAKDIHLSLSDGLEFMSLEEHVAQISGLFAGALNLHASQRLFTALCHEAFRRQGPSGLSLRNLVSLAEKINAAQTSKSGTYRDSLLFALRDLLQRSGSVFDSAQSNFLKQMFSQGRTYIINWGGLTTDSATLLASLMYRYAYEWRRATGKNHPPIVIVADDALSFVSGSKARESEGHANPFAVYSHMGRSLGVGLITVAHNYSLISPTLRHNTDTVISLGSHGDDASALARFMSLTPEQAEMLPRIRPGTGIAITRSLWPYAVMGAVPMIV